MPVDRAFGYMVSAGLRVGCPEVLPALGRLLERSQVLVFLNHQ
jgi:hypothetical protein